MRRVLTLVILAAVAGTATAAAVDALLGSSPEQRRGQTQASEPPRETSSTTVPDAEIPLLPSWRGVRVRRIRLDRNIGATWEEVRMLEPASYLLHARSIVHPPWMSISGSSPRRGPARLTCSAAKVVPAAGGARGRKSA